MVATTVTIVQYVVIVPPVSITVLLAVMDAKDSFAGVYGKIIRMLAGKNTHDTTSVTRHALICLLLYHHLQILSKLCS